MLGLTYHNYRRQNGSIDDIRKPVEARSHLCDIWIATLRTTCHKPVEVVDHR
ncbi:hypothetical protein ACVWW6_008995 [Bradyrhizobium sp. USDA 3311]